jgi:hypothetical protein
VSLLAAPSKEISQLVPSNFPSAEERRTVEEFEEVTVPKGKPIGQEFELNLKDPVFDNGVVSTDQGGIITGEGLRIQAQKIVYTNRIENGVPVKKVVAEGDLLLQYADSAFVGSRLEFDFLSRSGTLHQGKTFVDLWFLGGERIELRPDGSYVLYDAFITTCESQENTWDLNAGMVKITRDHLLQAQKIRFRFFKFPVFWLPSFKSNLKTFKDPPIKYKILWDKGLGPRATMRYRIYSWEDFNLFFRLDYRLKRGFGAALESEYYSPDSRTMFLTRSYGAHDKSVPDERGPRRFRLQGLLDHKSADGKTQVHMTYDRFSDNKMPGDFRTDDFEVNTQKRTLLVVNHQEESLYGTLSFQPRINRFQSQNQELPLLSTGIRTFEIARTGILSENWMNAGFLDYVFAKDLHHYLRNTHALRIETLNTLYRPIPLRYLTLTPQVGFIGIFYNNNPERTSVGQAVFSYGGTASTRLGRRYERFKHVIEPYATYTGLSHPKAGLNQHFIFNIDDGYYQLNMLQAGLRNTLFSLNRTQFLPSVTADLFAIAFFDTDRFSTLFPKAYLTLGVHRPSYMFAGDVVWNIEERVLDRFNIRTGITVSEDLACALEYRHRSKFDWRKADHENFILDMARSVSTLLHSPLSDGRNTLLANIRMRLSPEWELQFQSQYGWGRRNEPSYHSERVDFFTSLTCSWRLRFSVQHTPNDTLQFSGSIFLVK